MAQRYFVPELPPPGRATLVGDVAHHLGRVARARPGERVLLGDGRGGTAEAIVHTVARGEVVVDVAATAHTPAIAPALTLAFACPKPARADWLFEHATELGVACLWPITTSRSRPQGERSERWQKIVASAAGQCDRAWVPEVREATDLRDLLRDARLPARRLLADADGDPLAPSTDGGPTILLVGPEGGFAPEEREAALAAGFAAVRFGPHTLRTETAAMVGAALVLCAAPTGGREA